MNKSYGARAKPVYMNAEIEQAQVLKWVIIPGMTLTGLIILSRLAGKKKKRR